MISNTIKCNEFTLSRVQLTNAPGLDKVLECATTLLQAYTDFCMCSFNYASRQASQENLVDTSTLDLIIV